MLSTTLSRVITVIFLFVSVGYVQAQTPSDFKATISGYDCEKQVTSIKELIETQIWVVEKEGKYSLTTTCGNKFWDVSFAEKPIQFTLILRSSDYVTINVTFDAVSVTLDVLHYGSIDEKVEMVIPFNFFVFTNRNQIQEFLNTTQGKMLEKLAVQVGISFPVTENVWYSRDVLFQKIEKMLSPVQYIKLENF